MWGPSLIAGSNKGGSLLPQITPDHWTMSAPLNGDGGHWSSCALRGGHTVGARGKFHRPASLGAPEYERNKRAAAHKRRMWNKKGCSLVL